jgi:hypothetical protein
MNTFKSFLTENNQYFISPNVSIKIHFDKSQYKGLISDFERNPKHQQLLDAFKEFGGNEEFSAYFVDNEFTFVFNVSDTSIIDTQEHLNEFMKKIQTALESFLNIENSKLAFPETISVYCWAGLPKIFVGCNKLHLILNKGKLTLTDLHKYCDVETLAFYGLENVTGNVLSILKMKKLKQIQYSGDDKIEWLDIVKKYIDSKDIIACQEELIEAGLKEFAKL